MGLGIARGCCSEAERRTQFRGTGAAHKLELGERVMRRDLRLHMPAAWEDGKLSVLGSATQAAALMGGVQEACVPQDAVWHGPSRSVRIYVRRRNACSKRRAAGRHGMLQHMHTGRAGAARRTACSRRKGEPSLPEVAPKALLLLCSPITSA